MRSDSDLYEDTAVLYTRLVRHESAEAADVIDQIHVCFGAHAALRAALVITQVKLEVLQNEWIPGIKQYAHLLEDYPDAVLMMKRAIACCLRAWDATQFELETKGWIEKSRESKLLQQTVKAAALDKRHALPEFQFGPSLA